MATKLGTLEVDLAGLRRQKGLSLAEIATQTKIGVNYLEAIERGLFSKLPGGIYNLSYIRQYARAIECDEARLLDYYRRWLTPISAERDKKEFHGTR